MDDSVIQFAFVITKDEWLLTRGKWRGLIHKSDKWSIKGTSDGNNDQKM